MDTLEQLAHSPAKLQSLLKDLRAAKRLDHPRAPGKWTPRQIALHLADVETLQTSRYMTFLTQDNGSLIVLQPDAWAQAGIYTERDPELSAQTFTKLRERHLELLRQLTPAQWARTATHPIRGEFRLETFIQFVASHDTNHLAQLEQSLP